MSSNVMVCVAELAFPQPSVTVHVRVITLSARQEPSEVLTESEYVTEMSALHTSAASITLPVKAKSFTSLSHSIVTSIGAVKVGAIWSLKVTSTETDEVLPQASVAVYVRMNDSSPEQLTPVTSSTKVTSTLEQLSVAVGAAGISSPHCNSTAAATSLNTGATSSKTEMVCVAVALFPQPSVKVYSRTTSKHPDMPSAVLDVSVQETATAALQLSLNSTAPYSMDSS